MDIGLAFFTFIYRHPFARSMACIYIFITANLKFTTQHVTCVFPSVFAYWPIPFLASATVRPESR